MALMKTIRKFDPLADRSQLDCRLCRPAGAWAQVDTTQDASYYGVWTNPETLQIVTYCEGDITVQTADSEAEYVEAVRNLHIWNVERGFWKGVDALCNAKIVAAFHRLGLEALLH